MSLRLIKNKVRAGEVIYTDHIYEKLDEINRLFLLNLTTDDIDVSILNGELVEILDNDTRGKRYVIIGEGLEGTTLETVCRIKNDVIIITVYSPYF